MRRKHIVSLLVLLAWAPLSAQDEEPAADPAAAPEVQEIEAPTTAADEVTDEEIEALLDDEDYLGEDEDDFLPSIEVRYEQSIPFPTDI